MGYRAILFDTRSIQKYIYFSNELKTNIGASYLVENLFQERLMTYLREQFGDECIDSDSWRSEPDIEFLATEGHVAVVYIGGGKALLILATGDDATAADAKCRKLIAEFSTRVLVECPGLQLGAAFKEIDLVADNAALKEQLDGLYGQIKYNRATVFPQVDIPYVGLTVPCPMGHAAGTYWSGRDGFISHEVHVKEACAEQANRHLQQQFQATIGDKEFPLRFDDLGQQETENYIAVVHIDGNNMGARFRACTSQSQYRQLSEAVKAKTVGCFDKLLKKIVDEYEWYVDKVKLKLSGKYLPIRPLILGGDDVTFVCPAKLAIRFAKAFMEYMADAESVAGILPSVASIDCCGGIGIFKTSYPFFRGYELTEQLCDAAKREMRALKKGDSNAPGSCWLDFALLHGEQAPTLEQIQAQEYRGARGNMHFGPYRVGNHQTKKGDHSHDIENLIDCVQGLHDGKALPMNKIKELRWVLQHGQYEAAAFAQQMKHMGQHLPDVPAWREYAASGSGFWAYGRTPYVDVIEMMDFIPKEDAAK